MKKLIVFLIGGVLMVTNVSAENFYQIEVEPGGEISLVFDSPYAVGLFNSFKKFEEMKYGKRKQILKNFQVYIVHGKGENHGQIQVSFSPNLAPGEELILGGGTSLGMGLVVHFSPDTGEVVEARWSR